MSARCSFLGHGLKAGLAGITILLVMGFCVPVACAESLYDATSYRSLAGDHKAFRVGDLITVQVYEQSSASTSTDTTTQRNNAGVTYYAAIGTIAEVAVDTATGQIELLDHHSILECGTPIVPELVSSQLQGGLAMGIGHALHEFLPLYEDGPGDGSWNFNRYQLPRARDVAVWAQTGEILPPLSPSDAPKGMAEVVMIAVVPAIANAVTHAIGHRFRELPITPDKIQAALAAAESAPRAQQAHA